MSVYHKIAELLDKGVSCALVTVIKTNGSTPRGIGSKMLVEAVGAIHETIGGSKVEALVIEEALQAIREGKPRVVSHDLHDESAKDTGMICGGYMEFFIEPILSADRVIIFGGGHVGLPTANILKQAGFDYIIVDDRSGFANYERFPEARRIMVGDPGNIARDMELLPGDYVVIVTRGHQHDYQVLREVIMKDCRYIGMIASRAKRDEIFDRLRNLDHIAEDRIKRVHSPIGMDIKAETPEEIAISIAAELIKVKRS
jgi:xanthine dehydrogenase accessory factor